MADAGFAIVRAKKQKTRGQISASAGHNFRLHNVSNADPEKSKLNRILFNPLGVDATSAPSLQTKLTEYYKELGVKEKKNSVLSLEFVATASPEFFEGKSPAQVNAWANHQIEFFKSKFGDNFKLAILHLDEKTPHIHLTISAEEESVKKYKNQFGEQHKKTWGLNAARWNPEFFVQLQTDFADHNKKFGLKRGIHRPKGKRPIHQRLKDFYRAVEGVMTTNHSKAIAQQVEKQSSKSLLGKVLGWVGLAKKSDVEAVASPVVSTIVKQKQAFGLFTKLNRFQTRSSIEKLRKDREQALTEKAEAQQKYTQSLKDSAPVKVKQLKDENQKLSTENESLKATIEELKPTKTKPEGSVIDFPQRGVGGRKGGFSK